MHPFLGAFCPALIVSDIRLEFIYPALRSLQLVRKLLSDVSCCLEVCLSRASGAINQLKNGVPGSVHYIDCSIFRYRGSILNSSARPVRILANGFQRICSLISHRTTRISKAPKILATQSKLNFSRFDGVDNLLWSEAAGSGETDSQFAPVRP
jgi:hypothetical protein